MSADMKITALAPWLGSKRGMAGIIIRQLGPHACYWEPFCGSLAVLLAKPAVANETVCDLHGDLINLARVLQGESSAESLYERLNRTLAHESLFEEAKKRCDGDPEYRADPDRAYWFFVKSWLERNGVAGTERSNFCLAVRWTRNGGGPAVRFRSAVESIPAWHYRLCNVLILQRDGLAVTEKIEDETGTALYVDPPYFLSTRKGDRGGGRYRHEFSEADHVKLAGLLRRFRKARVVISYYADDRLSSLYPGWTQIDCARMKHLSVQGRRGATKQDAPEVLVINGPAFGGNGDLFA